MNSHVQLPPVEAAIIDLKARFGTAALTGESIRDLHARDESHHHGQRPDVVVYPKTTQEVADLVAIATRHQVPVVAFGAGSGLEGGAIPVAGGISVDLSGLDAIFEIRADDMIARVGAGVRRLDLNTALRDTGLFFPVDPGANASIGGMVSTGASGTNAVRFGVMRENVLGLTVVTAGGRIVRTGSLARKSSSGYDLTRLFVGAEGTLGVVTEVILRLHPIPEARSAHAGFATLAGAVNAVTDIKRAGLSIGRVELLDQPLVEVVNRHGEMRLEPLPTLFFEFHGATDDIRSLSGTVGEIVAANGGTELTWTAPGSETQTLWTTRRDCLAWAKAERQGAHSWPSDVCVPISRLADVILETREDVAGSDIPAYIVGHVGDGNFHCVFMLRDNEEAEVADYADRIVMRALAAGGTASGEHGVGLGKRKFLITEHGADAVALMHQLKAALDPLGIFNPGKILPDPAPSDLINTPGRTD
ncbi:FAD-binding protein [Rhizobium sp. CG5]|uniref:FAD-binding oxidoreductase n=1 Tax=Rhizobium sp. CG5 TaxID=2726076 RepID=UPI0020337F2E|nr:FAD-linked oxidase C-terminal domain-containing protein [Rhizobium sp. CG5]MCM2474975.1 FAD-binding protein [Rhizobium sp. CG5]